MDTSLHSTLHHHHESAGPLRNPADVHTAELVSRYQTDLAQKDELIGALIQELEQAVEQLDRVKRSGGDRSILNESSPSISPLSELTSSRSPKMDDLRQMADDWAQTQPSAALARIESELAAVHDLVRNLQLGDRPRPELGRFEDCVRQLARDAEMPAATELDTVNMTLDESSPSWEAIKSQLYESSAPTMPAEAPANDEGLLKLLAETPAPREVDFERADMNELKLAVSERDSYIIQINRLFRMRRSWTLPSDWAELGRVPEEMKSQVESLIENLDVQVRLGEVEMSLERARLTRERSHIQAERESIEKHMKRLGLTSLSELDKISATTGTAGDRRWMRFLGQNNK